MRKNGSKKQQDFFQQQKNPNKFEIKIKCGEIQNLPQQLAYIANSGTFFDCVICRHDNLLAWQF